MIYSAREEQRAPRPHLSRSWLLVSMSGAVRIDAQAIGLSIAILGVAIGCPAAIFGVTAAALSLAGYYLGRSLGHLVGRIVEVFGGLVLIGVGTRILLAHLFGI